MTLQLIVIDDQEVDRYLVERVVKSWDKGTSVISIGNPKEALDLFVDRDRLEEVCAEIDRPIVVLLDINMPEMSGFELLDQLEALRSSDLEKELLCVMMFTSSHNQMDQERALSYPIVKDYLVKPLVADHLDKIVELHAALQKELTE